MPRRHLNPGYQSITPSVQRGERNGSVPAAKKAFSAIDLFTAQEKKQPANQASQFGQSSPTLLRRGHKMSYAALLAFTLVLYARPAEFYPSPLTASIALVLALIMLGFYFPTQLSLEGTLTARPREVNLVLLFCLAGLLSIPLAINPPAAWHEFSGNFIRCIVVFIAMVNVVRTKARLQGLLFLALAAGLWLSLGAINDYRLGLNTIEGYRVAGRGSGIFGNPNDMALFLVTIVPVAVALACHSRRLGRKLFFAGSAIVMFTAIVLTYSRGGFLGLLVALGFFACKTNPRRRVAMLIGLGVTVAMFLAMVPGYAIRLVSIVIPSLDPVGSSDARSGELFRSLYIAIRHPLLGIGMGNYAPEMSYRGLVTHNSYTQVAAEMGMAALVCYMMFLLTPLKKLGQVARETFGTRADSDFYYLAVGLQASLLGYMVSSFFASVAYLWYVYYLVAYAVCLRRLYESETGREVVVKKEPKKSLVNVASAMDDNRGIATT
jgi:putative inorganic carbon (HCO3(-)) transporter